MAINEGPWPWVPSECGLALASWSVERSSLGYWHYSLTFEPLIWQETICRWLDEQVEL